MEGFYKIPSALKILLIELVAVFFFSVTLAGLITAIRPGIFPLFTELDGFEDWIMALVGPIFMAWALYDIFRPRVKEQTWGIFFRVSFRFCSTHPSYVLIDLLTAAFAMGFVWLGMVGKFETTILWVVLATASFFPVLRLASWYILGRKISGLEIRDAYKPALWVFCMFFLIFGGAWLGIVLN